MVKMLRLIFINFKMSVKDKSTIALMFITPLVVILGLNLIGNKGGYTVGANIAINIKDAGIYGEEVIEEMNILENIFYNEEDKAIELLERNEIVAVYQIPEDFTEEIQNGDKPQIEAFKREEGNTTLAFELNLEDQINKRLKREILYKNDIIENIDDRINYKTGTIVKKSDKNKVDSGYSLAMMMIIYFTILSSSSIGEKIVGMKKQNILSRTMSTANRGYEILGSLCLSILLLEITVNLAVLFITKLIIGFTIPNIPVTLVNIVLVSLFSITFTMFMTRIFENQSLVSFGIVIFSIASLFLSIIALEASSFPKVPFIVKNLGKLTPVYWLLDSVETLNLFPNAVVVFLMILALFTGGNYKLKNFINRG